ncbi:filamentous hemagglutinin family protein [Burkholderia sp. JKS000303]|nr:filamentous hemagglutinin N-terminal domain-containing protein [Burkholderia sp. JKS000303]PFH19512.1 filamentous hemagglutinin family protein [Burkholderia sp. JKS000303]
MSVNQHTDKLITNWQDFRVAGGERVSFHQPTSQSLALNRVIGNNGSRIDGQIGANGHVFLVNRNGVLFGSGAQVNIGGLVASTQSATFDGWRLHRSRQPGLQKQRSWKMNPPWGICVSRRLPPNCRLGASASTCCDGIRNPSPQRTSVSRSCHIGLYRAIQAATSNNGEREQRRWSQKHRHVDRWKHRYATASLHRHRTCVFNQDGATSRQPRCKRYGRESRQCARTPGAACPDTR